MACILLTAKMFSQRPSIKLKMLFWLVLFCVFSVDLQAQTGCRNVIRNGTFSGSFIQNATPNEAWLPATGAWALNTTTGIAVNNLNGVTNSAMTQNIGGISLTPVAGIVSLYFDLWAGNSGDTNGASTATLTVSLGGTIYATFTNPTGAGAVTTTLSNGATISGFTSGVVPTTFRLVSSQIRIDIPWTQTASNNVAALSFAATTPAAGDDWGVDNIYIGANCIDSDQDFVVDVVDIDDDNDGIRDVDEGVTSCSPNITPNQTTSITEGATVNNTNTTISNNYRIVGSTATQANQTVARVSLSARTGATTNDIGIDLTTNGSVQFTNNAGSAAGQFVEVTYEFNKPIDAVLTWQAGNTFDDVEDYSVEYDAGVTSAIYTAGGTANLNVTQIPGKISLNSTVDIASASNLWNIDLKNVTRLVIRRSDTGTGGAIGGITITPATFCDRDTDGDLIPDHLDVDADQDGCYDAREGGSTQALSSSGTIGGTYGANGLSSLVETNDTVAAGINYAIAQTAGINNFMQASVFTSCLTAGSDSDGDLVSDRYDMDDDNDGILDSDENACAVLANRITGNFSGSGPFTGSTLDGVNVTATVTNAANTSVTNSAGTFANEPTFWSEAVNNLSSFQTLFNWDTTAEGYIANIDQANDDKGSATITFTFSQPVYNPIIHLDRIGGLSGVIPNSAVFTVTTPGATLKKLAGTSNLYVTPTTFRRVTEMNVNPLITGVAASEASALPENGTAAGSLLVEGVYSSLTFDWTGKGAEGSGGDGIEFIFSLCRALDSDGDTIANLLDLDSDNDGCSDSNEYYNNAASAASGQQFGQLGGAVAPVLADGRVNLSAATYTGSYANVTNNAVSTVCTANIAITKTASSSTPNVGSNVTFTLTATNAGPSDATGVSVTDVLPSGYTFVSASTAAGTYTIGTGIWDIGTLANGSNATLSIIATVNASGSYTNSASIAANEADPTPGDNTSNVTPTPINIIVAVTETTPAVNGLPGGTTTALTSNDTLNGSPVVVGTAAGNVQITSSTVPVGSGLVVNADGTVTVPANTPSGNYSVSYTICEVNNPLNCSTISSTVVVSAPAIVAVTETTPAVNGLPGGTTTALTSNDTLNGSPVVVGTAAGNVQITSSTVPVG
ncbi:DUF11 domain-containing protein, partial [Flavobacterium sp. Fl-77]